MVELNNDTSAPYIRINEKKLKKLHKLGYSDKIISKKLGASKAGICRARQRMGLKPNFHSNKYKKGLINKIMSLGNDNRTPRKIYENDLKKSKQWRKDNPKRCKELKLQWLKKQKLKEVGK